MLLTVLFFSLGLCVILFAIAHDINVFKERVEQAYTYAKDTVPNYLEDEKDFIFETFLPTLVRWKPQHFLLHKTVSLAFLVTLFTTIGALFFAVKGMEPVFVLFIQAIDAGIIATYFSFFRPQKAMLYSKMNYYDSEIEKIQESAH